MWVRAKRKTQVSATQFNQIQMMLSIQEGSKWLAFHEPKISPSLPWRVNHRHLNIRITENMFKELFEELSQEKGENG